MKLSRWIEGKRKIEEGGRRERWKGERRRERERENAGSSRSYD